MKIERQVSVSKPDSTMPTPDGNIAAKQVDESSPVKPLPAPSLKLDGLAPSPYSSSPSTPSLWHRRARGDGLVRGGTWHKNGVSVLGLSLLVRPALCGAVSHAVKPKFSAEPETMSMQGFGQTVSRINKLQ